MEAVAVGAQVAEVPLAYEAGNFYHHAAFFHALGGRVFSEQGEGPVDLDTRATADSFAYVKGLIDRGSVPPEADGALMEKQDEEDKAARLEVRVWAAMSFSLKNSRKTRLLHRWRVSLRQNVIWPRLEGFGIRFPNIALPKRRWCRGGPRKHLTVRHSWCSLLTRCSKFNRTKQEQKRMQHC